MTIGAPGAGHGNVVSGNDLSGVSLDGSSHNVVQGNLIGSDSSGHGRGAQLRTWRELGANSQGNQIGDVSTGAGNTIAFNYEAGVYLGSDFASNNLIRGNIDFLQLRMGIDLTQQGIGGLRSNDTNDTDIGSQSTARIFPS